MQSDTWTSFQDLLQAVEGGTAQELAPLLRRAQPFLINLLKYKGKSPEARRQVESADFSLHGIAPTVQEKQLALSLSDALEIDELCAADLLVTARLQRGEVSIADAAGLYYEERRALLTVLLRLLQIQLGHYPASSAEVEDLVTVTLRALVSDDAVRSAGHTVVSRLCDIVQVESQKATSAAVTDVRDEYGGIVSSAELVAQEASLACQALFLLTVCKPRAAAADVTRVLSLLRHLEALHAADPTDPLRLKNAYLALAALLALLTPAASGGGGEGAPDEPELRALTAPGPLRTAFASLPSSGGFAAAAQLAWGLLESEVGDGRADDGAASKLVADALRAGVFRFLSVSVLASVPFKDEGQEVQERVCTLLLKLALRYAALSLRQDDESRAALHAAGASVWEPPRPSASSPPSSALALRGAAATHRPAHDDPASFLDLLADVVSHFSHLQEALGIFQDDAVSAFWPLFVELLQQVPRLPALKQPADALSPPGCGAHAHAAYLRLLRAFGDGPTRAFNTVDQLVLNATHETHEHVSWKDYFVLLKDLHDRYQNVTADSRAMGAEGARQDSRIATLDERVVAVAYTELLASLMTVIQAHASVEERTHVRNQLQQECNPATTMLFTELLMQVMCMAVPPALKAALDDALGAWVCDLPEAAQLLERLQHTELVRNRALPGTSLATQLATVSEVEEEYSEMIAYVRMINRVCAVAGPTLVQRPEMHAYVLQYTSFIVDPLFSEIGVRRYAVPAQQFELAEVCLQHMTMCVRHMQEASALGLVSDTTGLLGAFVLSQFLSQQGRLLQEMLVHVLGVQGALQPASVDRLVLTRQRGGAGLAAEKATEAALELISALFEMDEAFVAEQQAAPQSAVATLDALLMRNSPWAIHLVQYVRFEANPKIQAASIKLAGHLAERDPRFVHVLLQHPAEARHLVYDYTLCLNAGLFGVLEGGGDAPESCAALILRVLQDNAEKEYPNLMHVMLGYSTHGGPEALAFGPGSKGGSCLQPILAALESPHLPVHRPALFKAAWHLVGVVTEARADDDALLRVVTGRAAFLDVLSRDSLTQSPRGQDTSAPEWPEQLYCRAWVLKVAALALHAMDGDNPDEAERCRAIARRLFVGAPDRDESLAGGALPDSVLWPALECLSHAGEHNVAAWLKQQQVDERDLAALDLTTLLQQRASVEQGGALHFDDVHGVWLFEGRRLRTLLEQRWNAYRNSDSGRHDPRIDAKEAAVRVAFEYAVRWNASQLEHSACCMLASAWCATVQVACCRRFRLLCSALVSPIEHELAAAALLLRSLFKAALECVHTLLSSTAALSNPAPIVLPLLQTAHALLLQLQSQCDVWLDGGLPLAALLQTVMPAAFCREAVSGLLRLTDLVSNRHTLGALKPDVAYALHACLLTHLNMTNSASLCRVELHRFSTPSDAAAPAAQDELHAVSQLQSEIDAANTAALAAGSVGEKVVARLKELLEGREVQGSPARTSQRCLHQALALHLLVALLAADRSGALAGRLERHGLLSCVLGCLGEESVKRLHAPPPLRRHFVRLTQAYLLFLRTFATSPAAACAQRCQELLDRGLFAQLRASRVLSLAATQPSGEPGAGAVLHLRVSLLRLLLVAGTALRDSSEAQLEVLQTVLGSEPGCLGERALELLSAAAQRLESDDGALPEVEEAQAEALAGLLRLAGQMAERPAAPPAWQEHWLLLRSRALALLDCLCRRADGAGPSSAFALGGASPGPSRPVATQLSFSRADFSTNIDADMPTPSFGAMVAVGSPRGARQNGFSGAPATLPLGLALHCVALLRAAMLSPRNPMRLEAERPMAGVDGLPTFSLPRLMALLSWTCKQQHTLQRRSLQLRFSLQLQRRRAGGGAGPSGGADSRSSGELSRDVAACEKALRQCVALAESCLAAVLMAMQQALRGMELTRDCSSAEEILRRVAVMQEEWDDVSDSRADGAGSCAQVVDLLRACKECATQIHRALRSQR